MDKNETQVWGQAECLEKEQKSEKNSCLVHTERNW